MSTTTTAIITLAIEARGEIVSSNFEQFAEMVRNRLGEINRDLKTDEDFDQADADAKAIAGAEAELKAAKERALAQAVQLNDLFSRIDDLSGEMAQARLDLAKQIAKRKEEVKAELIEEALATFDIDPPLARRAFLAGLQTAIKGKRTLETMRSALRIYATTQQAVIKKSRSIIASFEAAHGVEMLMDRRDLELRPPAEVEGELRRRFDLKKAAEDRKRAEEDAARARAEAAKAKQDLAEANKPPLPPAAAPPSRPTPVDDSPFDSPQPPAAMNRPEPPPEDDGGAAEWAAFRAAVCSAFAPLKAAREKLTHLENRRAAQRFAEAVNQAWKEANQ